MKIATFLLLSALAAGQSNQPPAHGVIHGTVNGPDGQLAKGVTLEAYPLGVALAARLPRTKTNQSGEYRFTDIPWWGRYTVYAEDEDAGYSYFANGPAAQPPEVELSPEHPEATLDLRLPEPAGFLHIHLTNRKTGNEIQALAIGVTTAEDTPRFLMSKSCGSDRVILLPPYRDLLIHVSSQGFEEWDESIGRGKAIRMTSGSHLKLEIQLTPSGLKQ